jgi:hypothetical protein
MHHGANIMKTENENWQAAKDALQEAAQKWPSEFFTREDIRAFTGNAISVGHLANLDSQGDGPKGSFRLGRRRVYPKKPFVEWLIGRLGVKA